MRLLTATLLVCLSGAALFAFAGEGAAPAEPGECAGGDGAFAARGADGEGGESGVAASPVGRTALAEPAPPAIPTIAGIVFDELGQPVPDIAVLAVAGEGVNLGTARSDALGVFRIACQPPCEGARLVVPAMRGFDALTTREYACGSAGVRLCLTRAGDLEISAVDAGAAIEEYAISWAFQDHSGVWCPGREWNARRPGGRAVLHEVPAGRVRLVLLPRDRAHAPNEPFEFVKPPGPFTVRVALPRREPIPVSVVDAAGRPVVGVEVRLLRPLDDKPVPDDIELVDPGHLGETRTDRTCVLQLDVAETDRSGRAMLGWRRDRGPMLLRVLGGRVPVLADATVAPVTVTLPGGPR